MEILPRDVVPGAVVHARGDRWLVREARRFAAGAVVTLDALDPGSDQRSATLLLPFDRIETAGDAAPVRRRRQAVIRGALHALSQDRPQRGLWALHRARVDLLAWQLAPALAALDGATRLLLADAVGLGKTIQAGLVLAELRARGLAERALVLTPAAMRESWAGELRRFDLHAAILDLPAILELERTGAVAVNPWSRAAIVVSSIDLVKRPEVRSAVEHAPVDLLVVDEAHHATPGTDRYAAVSRLARQVPWVVLASATPHSGDAAAYRALLGLGEVPGDGGGGFTVFRRSHDEARLSVVRRTHVLQVRPTEPERRLHTEVLAYARDLARAAAASGVQLLASVLARRATSSPRAIRRTLQRRLDALGQSGTPAEPIPGLLPWEEIEEGEVEQPWPAAVALGDPAVERDRLQHLVGLAAAAEPAWSKGVRLRRLLARAGEPAIVFSEFRDTLEACAGAIGPEAALSCLHGELDAAERGRRLEAFLRGDTRVLLTTDVAGEGLNLQTAARMVVSVEWPWSPLRIEQRIGRVHRLGQRRSVHVFHLTASDSYERTVVARMLDRAARAAADLGPAAASAAHVAAAVLGVDVPESIVEPPTTPGGVWDERARSETARVAGLRALAARGAPLRGGVPVWATPRRGAAATRVVALIEVRRSVAGWLNSSRLVAVVVTLHARPRHRREWRQICRSIATDPRVRLAATASASPAPRQPWVALEARLRALSHLRQSRRAPPVQPSLFDRRALGDAESVAAVRRRWDEWQARLEARCRSRGGAAATATRVIAVLPLCEARR